ncbi:Transcription factor tau subunit sfc4 [Neolecta irregularis DAH-3]|uniref:Transcription factor tau subunit sfc4 n=1 Tax=Neolecta irregularis (strain DAH-3) TaxID=1198029 RepID=A0A1U7LN11_NEOID|nr:Transcription factor tau subunit sfc4 [Neolecta irregularis DAH-3]|eukprot:OLL23932.1 Transcription factor tau subunit sfc4 [Neolecta irregularis DAH-3]
MDYGDPSDDLHYETANTAYSAGRLSDEGDFVEIEEFDKFAAFEQDDSDDSDYINEDFENVLKGVAGVGSNFDLVDTNGEMSDFHNDLKAVAGFKKVHRDRRGGRRAMVDLEPSHEVKGLMGRANQAYATGDLDEALKHLKEIIRIDFNVFSAWQTLGLVHKERGNEEKCLLAWITAAHLRPKEADLWIDCARMSQNSQHYSQAIYCLNRAIRHQPTNVSVIWERTLLYKSLKNTAKVIEGFKLLLNLVPNDMNIIRELSRTYIDQNRISDAVQLYESALASYQNRKTRIDASGDFGWSELNMMSELYMLGKRWAQCINLIKICARWLNGRRSESYWDEFEDDREFDIDDDRRKACKKFNSNDHQDYSLPIDIRVKLGLCRLRLGILDESMRQFDLLMNHDPSNFADALFDVGESLCQEGYFEEALEFFAPLIELEATNGPSLWSAMAKCYKGLGDMEDAEECYRAVIATLPKDIDSRIQLAEFYESMERREEALTLVNEVLRLRKEQHTPPEIEGGNVARSVEDNAALIESQVPGTTRSRKPGCRSTLEERLAAEKERCEQIIFRNRKLEMLEKDLDKGQSFVIKEWMETAAELIDDFRHVSAFYPSERSTKFTGLRSLTNRSKKVDLDKSLKGMATRLQTSIDLGDGDVNPHDAEETEFRGLSFDRWLDIFLQYAILLTCEGDIREAYEIIKSAQMVNVFYQNSKRNLLTYVVNMACAFQAMDFEEAQNTCRWFTNTFRFMSDGYRFWNRVSDTNALVANPSTKYLLRQIKAIDGAMTGDTLPGSATLSRKDSQGDPVKPNSYNVSLLMLYGHGLAAARSHIHALNYYTRAFSLVPTDPLINLSIAIAHLHRAMQRQTSNRQHQILQGLIFLFHYYEWRIKQGLCERQEAEFNVGRAFHQLGLMHLAIPYYERVLALSHELHNAAFESVGIGRQDLASETAGPLAKEVTLKFLTL